MMKALSILLLSLVTAGSDPLAWIGFEWNYPPAELAGQEFHLYTAEDLALPLESWTGIAQVTAGTNVVVSMVPGRHFFVVSISNIWGQVFSETTNTVFAPRTFGGLLIYRP